jgi:hypothetical protein
MASLEAVMRYSPPAQVPRDIIGSYVPKYDDAAVVMVELP